MALSATRLLGAHSPEGIAKAGSDRLSIHRSFARSVRPYPPTASLCGRHDTAPLRAHEQDRARAVAAPRRSRPAGRPLLRGVARRQCQGLLGEASPAARTACPAPLVASSAVRPGSARRPACRFRAATRIRASRIPFPSRSRRSSASTRPRHSDASHTGAASLGEPPARQRGRLPSLFTGGPPGTRTQNQRVKSPLLYR